MMKMSQCKSQATKTRSSILPAVEELHEVAELQIEAEEEEEQPVEEGTANATNVARWVISLGSAPREEPTNALTAKGRDISRGNARSQGSASTATTARAMDTSQRNAQSRRSPGE